MLTFCPIASRSARPNGRSAAVLRNCICCEFACERFELHERHNEEERSRSAAETRVPIVAVSTSGGYGFCFNQEERFNRLLLVRIRLLLPHINVARVHLKNAAGAVLNLAPMVVAC